jgi:hypothetical protein
VNYCLEFHDSEIQNVTKKTDGLNMQLLACIHESNGKPGVDSGKSYFQEATIELNHYDVINGSLAIGRISDGFILDYEDNEIELSLPLNQTTPSTLILAFSDGATAQILCRALSINAGGLKSNVQMFVP